MPITSRRFGFKPPPLNLEPGRLFRRRCFGKTGQHSDFPCSTLANVSCRPVSAALKCRTGCILPAHRVFANSDHGVGSDRCGLCHSYFDFLHPSLERSVVDLSNISMRSGRVHENTVAREEASDSRAILLVEVLRERSSYLLDFLLAALIISSTRRANQQS